MDPFSGEIRDGFIYGRGVIDNKGAVAAYARAMMRLAAQKTPLSRDIIFLAEADEEQGAYNTSWLAQEHWDKMDSEFALNEGGGIYLNKQGKVSHIDVSCADKITLSLRLVAHGTPGHSSRPLPIAKTANGQLIEALSALQHHETKIQLLPHTRAMLEGLTRIYPQELGQPVAALLAAADDAGRAAAARHVISAADREMGDGSMEGLLRNTIVVTMIESGLKPNIIPGRASAVINTRLLPQTRVYDFIDEVRRVINNPGIEIEIINARPKEELPAFFRQKEELQPSPIDSDLFRSIERSVRQIWPGAETLPNLFVASTDATPWRARGVPVYGITLFPLDRESRSGIHGNDERITVQAVYEGAAFAYSILFDVAAKRAPGSQESKDAQTHTHTHDEGIVE